MSTKKRVSYFCQLKSTQLPMEVVYGRFAPGWTGQWGLYTELWPVGMYPGTSRPVKLACCRWGLYTGASRPVERRTKSTHSIDILRTQYTHSRKHIKFADQVIPWSLQPTVMGESSKDTVHRHFTHCKRPSSVRLQKKFNWRTTLGYDGLHIWVIYLSVRKWFDAF